jgi:hypothetical protein
VPNRYKDTSRNIRNIPLLQNTCRMPRKRDGKPVERFFQRTVKAWACLLRIVEFQIAKKRKHRKRSHSFRVELAPSLGPLVPEPLTAEQGSGGVSTTSPFFLCLARHCG